MIIFLEDVNGRIHSSFEFNDLNEIERNLVGNAGILVRNERHYTYNLIDSTGNAHYVEVSRCHVDDFCKKGQS